MDTFECPKCSGIDTEVKAKLEKLKIFFQRTSPKDNPKHWYNHVDELLTLKGTKNNGTFNVHLNSRLDGNKLSVSIFGQCELCNWVWASVESYDLFQ